MNDLLSVAIESERLSLVAVSDDFAQHIFTEFTPEITRWMSPKSADSIGDTLEFINHTRAGMAAGRELTLAVLRRGDREFLGVSGLYHMYGDAPELGVWIKLSAHGHRYGREAVAALADWAWANVSFGCLLYPVDRRNLASRSIPESLGAAVEAEYSDTSQSGVVLDLLEYRIYPPPASGMSSAQDRT